MSALVLETDCTKTLFKLRKRESSKKKKRKRSFQEKLIFSVQPNITFQTHLPKSTTSSQTIVKRQPKRQHNRRLSTLSSVVISNQKQSEIESV